MPSFRLADTSPTKSFYECEQASHNGIFGMDRRLELREH